MGKSGLEQNILRDFQGYKTTALYLKQNEY